MLIHGKHGGMMYFVSVWCVVLRDFWEESKAKVEETC
jgi:hypothetical protein